MLSTTAPGLRDAASNAAPRSVSIVIPAYNEVATIHRCLDAIARQVHPVHEIIVVDNRSTDGTIDAVDEWRRRHPNAPLRLLHQRDRQSITATRDLGFDAATGSIIGRIDADSRIDPLWTAAVTASLRDIDAVSGPVGYYDLPFETAVARIDDLSRRSFLALGRRYRFLLGSNMALRGDAWRAVRDRVDPDHGDRMHEDLDLAIALQRAGRSVGYDPRVRAAVSARRLDGTFAEYRRYVDRFRVTYVRHRLFYPHLAAPPLALLAAYWPLRALKASHARIVGLRSAGRVEPATRVEPLPC